MFQDSRCLLFAVVIMLGLASDTLAQTYLVQDGQARSCIVVAPDAARTTQIAAEELQAFIKRISGAELTIQHEPATDKLNIHVGPSQYTQSLGLEVGDLKHDAYRMASGENWLALLGKDKPFVPNEPWGHDKDDMNRVVKEQHRITGIWFGLHNNSPARAWRSYDKNLDVWAADGTGTLNAVYAFLHDLGCRFYFPGEIGEVVPTIKTIELPKVNKTVRPDFELRDFVQYYNQFYRAPEDEIKWQWRLGLNTGRESYSGGFRPAHGLHMIMSSEKLKESHPEYYALIDGQRQTKKELPCFSAPGLRDMTTKYVRFMYDQYDIPVVDISPPDGLGFRLCECELCKGKESPQRGRWGLFSNIIWGFVNDVAKEVYKTHPDRQVACIIYQQYKLPPEQIEQFSPNVVAMITNWRANIADDKAWQEVYDLRNMWIDRLPSKKIFRWDYYLHAGRDNSVGVPVYFPHTISKDLKWMKGRFTGEHVEVFRNFSGWKRNWHALATNHLNMYISARLYWDTQQNVDVLLEEYYEKFYGPAAGEMKAFVEYSEKHFNTMAKDKQQIDQAMVLIENAQKAAGSDNIYATRVSMVADYVKPLKQLRAKMDVNRQGNPEARIRKRDSAKLILDGKLDDDFWSNISPYPLLDSLTGQKPDIATSFKLGWDNDYFYIGIHCQEPDMEGMKIATTRKDDMSIWSGDVVEILIETLEQSYYQIAINPAGAITDLARTRNGMQMGWTADAQVATYKGKDFWTMEIRLPVPGERHAELFPNSKISGAPPSKTFPWHFNLGRLRIRDGQNQTYTFSPTEKKSFHVIERFGTLYMR